MPKKGTIKLSLELSPEVNVELEEFARKAHPTKSEVLRRSLGYYDIAAGAAPPQTRTYEPDPT